MAATLSASSLNSILCLAAAVDFFTEVFFAEALDFLALFFEVTIFFSCDHEEIKTGCVLDIQDWILSRLIFE